MDVINDCFGRSVKGYFIGLTHNSELHSEDLTYKSDKVGLEGLSKQMHRF